MDPTRRLTVIAVDDEPLALRRITMAMSAIDDAELLGVYRDPRKGVEAINLYSPDVVLLDINMADCSGFDVLSSIGSSSPEIIFVTAFEEYAVKAFGVQAAGYVLKPLEFEELRVALGAARDRILQREAAERAGELEEVIKAIREHRREPGIDRNENEIWAPRQGTFERLRVHEIDWVEAEGDYVRIYARDRTYLMRETMGRMEKRLGDQFRRVHRSALVNPAKVERVERPISGRYVLALCTGAKVPVGRYYLTAIRDWIGRTAPIQTAPEQSSI